MDKIKELLAVLDLPEEEQLKGLKPFIPRGDWAAVYWNYHFSLADLAFRLRDEADRTNFHNGIYEVQKYLKKEDWATAYWGEIFAKPIHWIIAALIAKASV